MYIQKPVLQYICIVILHRNHGNGFSAAAAEENFIRGRVRLCIYVYGWYIPFNHAADVGRENPRAVEYYAAHSRFMLLYTS